MGNFTTKSAQTEAKELPGILAPEMRKVDFSIAPARQSDIPKIASMINAEAEHSGAVLKVTEVEVKGWVAGGMSFVAKVGAEVVGHTAAKVWPESGWVEHRAVIVAPEFRGNGMNNSLTSAFVQAVTELYPDATIVSLKNGAALQNGSAHTIEKAGFKKVEDKTKIPDELFGSEEEKAQYDAYVYNYVEFTGLARK